MLESDRSELSWNSIFTIFKKGWHTQHDSIFAYVRITRKIQSQVFTMVVFQREGELYYRGLMMSMCFYKSPKRICFY